jgi:hypothetical protein
MEYSVYSGIALEGNTSTLCPFAYFGTTGHHRMSSAALALLPLFAITTAVSALVLWIALLWDAAVGISPPPRSRKKNKA